jgi:hypothetical protein
LRRARGKILPKWHEQGKILWNKDARGLFHLYELPYVLDLNAKHFAGFNDWRSMKNFKIVVEKHFDGYVAYPLGLKGIVIGEGGYL